MATAKETGSEGAGRALARALAANSSQQWVHYTAVQQCEPLLAQTTTAKQCVGFSEKSSASKDHSAQPSSDGATSGEDTSGELHCSPDCAQKPPLLPPTEASSEADAHGGICEKEIEFPHSVAASEAACIEPPVFVFPPVNTYLPSRYLAESLVGELHSQQALVSSCTAEALYVAATSPKLGPTTVSHPKASVELTAIDAGGESAHVEAPASEASPSAEHYLAKSLVGELHCQQMDVESRTAEARYVEALTSIVNKPEEEEEEEETDDWGMVTLELERPVEEEEEVQTLEPPPTMECDMGTLERVPTMDESCQTFIECTEVATETQPTESHSQSTNTDSIPLKDSQCNTDLSCFDLLRRAQEMQQLQLLKADQIVLQRQLNDERSKRMVAEQLSYIVQSDLDSLRSTNITEMTNRLRLENQLCDVKVELSHAQREAEEKGQRIKELEDSLAGSSVLVRKLEEQNSLTLMNRGGIDYMLQAKLAEGRAQEAEQKLEMLQAELLQSQGEVRRLLDRVGVASRERSEMVSSKVHTQLLQLADEKALEAESRAREMEREVSKLKDQVASLKQDKENPSSSSSSSAAAGGAGYLSPYGGALSSLSGAAAMSPFSYSSSSSSYSSTGLDTKLSGLYGFTSYSNGASLYGVSDTTATSSSLIGGFEPTNQKSSLTYSTSHDTSGGLRPSSLRDKPPVQPLKPKPKLSSKPQALPTDSAQGGLSLDLPAFDSASSLKPAATATSPIKHRVTFGGTKIAGESDSSGWSSSDEEEEEEGVDGGGGGASSPLKPSTHASLIAQWEWRSTHDEHEEDSSSSTVPAAASSSTPYPPPTASPSALRRRPPPPVAPKPAHLSGGRTSRDRTPPSLGGEGGTMNIDSEPPLSFNDETRAAGLHSVTLDRPRGPRGRRLPSRFRRGGLPDWLS